MADIDPITREALKRAAQMQGHPKRNNAPPQPPNERRERHHKAPEPPPEPPREHSHERPHEPPHERPPEAPNLNFGLEALFKDKETSVILILIILLMGEKGCEHLLLALIYLLI